MSSRSNPTLTPSSSSSSGALAAAAVDPASIFTVLEKLGEGAFGTVHKALDTRDASTVAIKELLYSSDNLGSSLQKEIKILSDCHSEYIVQYKGLYETKDNKAWVVMEYCGGGSLADIVYLLGGTLTEKQLQVVMKNALHGLAYLHGRRKIHRDIKAGNLLLTEAGECKLADFGVSAQLTDSVARSHSFLGTPHHLAPEVIRGVEYDYKVDVWSLAITAYELLVGQPPHYDLKVTQALLTIPSAPPPVLPDPSKYSHYCNDFLARCLQKDPTYRPTASALLTHPFIASAPENGKEIIQQLVAENAPKIEAARRQYEAARLARGTLAAIDDEVEDDGHGHGGAHGGMAGTVVARDYGVPGTVQAYDVVSSSSSSSSSAAAGKSIAKKSAFPETVRIIQDPNTPGYQGATLVVSPTSKVQYATVTVKPSDFPSTVRLSQADAQSLLPSAAARTMDHSYKSGSAWRLWPHATAAEVKASLVAMEVVQREEMAAMQRWWTQQMDDAKRALDMLQQTNGGRPSMTGPSAGTSLSSRNSSSSTNRVTVAPTGPSAKAAAVDTSLAARQQAATVVIPASSMPDFTATLKIV